MKDFKYRADMACPVEGCGSTQSYVVDTRGLRTRDVICRRRQCCGPVPHRFNTYESRLDVRAGREALAKFKKAAGVALAQATSLQVGDGEGSDGE